MLRPQSIKITRSRETLTTKPFYMSHSFNNLLQYLQFYFTIHCFTSFDFLVLPNASPSSIVVVSSHPFVSGKSKVIHAATRGITANNTGGSHNALSLVSTTKGATIEPIRAHIDENPRAALRTTVGNNSVQYKYTTTKTMKLDTTPILAHTTEPTPSGITANTTKQTAHIR